MKWTEYPTRRDWNAGKNGTQLEGQPLSAAPGGGKWVITADGRYHQVRRRYDTHYCIAEKCPQPPPPRPGERTCMVCGCTDSRACAGGCAWAPSGGLDGDICSRCQPSMDDLLEAPVSP